jgi:hypothetical protein
MPAPSVRYKILPARGDKTALDAAIAAIDEGEICYARDEDRFYVKESGVLVLTSMEEAPNDGTQYVRRNEAWEAVDVPPGTVVSNVAPVTPDNGQLWYDTEDARIFVWTGTEWADASPDAGNPTVITSDSAPGAPQDGDLWFRTSDGRMYVYYDDGASSQWVDANPATGASNWNYDGTTLTPGTAGTDVDLGTGSLSANSADIGSGNITLNADGTAVYNTPTNSSLQMTYGDINGSVQSIVQLNDNTGATASQWRPDQFWIGGTTASPNITLNADGSANFNAQISVNGINGRQGGGGNITSNYYNFYWTGSAMQMWVDQVNLGNVNYTSDYRAKRNVTPLADGAIDRVKQLKPVSFQWKDYEVIKESDQVLEGFIAHEVQEVIPSGASGEKDKEHQLQSLRLDGIVSVLTKALQESITRIEALESANAALEARLSTLEGN